MSPDDDAIRKALALARGGEWDASHRIVQSLSSKLACWLHANLHKEEGDLGNARYWYARVGEDRSDLGVEEERVLIEQRLGEKK